MKKHTTAILSTLAYADVFDYPLTKVGLWRFVIGTKMTWWQFDKTLEELIKEKKIKKVATYFVLPGRINLIKLRTLRNKAATYKLDYAKKIARLLGFLPTTQLVGISGALAMHNAPKEDDIDFFIITSPYTVWLTRCVMTFLLDIFHLRRKPGVEKWQNKICLNMFMDGEKLRLPLSDHNLYIAHEVAQLLPLINKNRTHERFLYENRWTKKYLPNAPITTQVSFNKSQPNIVLKLLAPVENLSRKIQLRYMRKRLTSERVSKTIIRFHPKDIKNWVLEEYKKKTFQLTRT